jgi:diaminopimelate epimerase
MSTRFVKAHVYGNDFLLVDHAVPGNDASYFARTLCHRHSGVGADGLLLYQMNAGGATMRLLNADGSASELSGNGLRCLAALVAREQNSRPGDTVTVATDAGSKRLELRAREGQRFTFRADMGSPEDVRQVPVQAAGETITATILRTGNPQCVVLGPLPDADRFNRLGPAIATHPMFPAGTNVEFVHVEAPDRIRISIWERGVGPTTSSGTGSCASAVAAATHGGAAREMDVIAPGGTQRVEWRDEGIFLTGWAEILCEGQWLTTIRRTD